MEEQFVLFASIALSLASAITYNVSVFLKSKRAITGMHCICNIFDILMYLVTGGRNGMANSVVNLCKNAAFSKLDSRKLTVFFSLVRILLLAAGWEGVLTFAFILAEVAVTVVLLKGTAQNLRYIYLVSQMVWVLYDYTFANIFVAAVTATSCISLVISIIKNRKCVTGA